MMNGKWLMVNGELKESAITGCESGANEFRSFTIDHLPYSSLPAWEQNLRALTAEAARAAELGRWDQVEECYRLRGEHLRDHPISPTLATGLTVLDQEVETRIANVRLAVQSQLNEAARIRQNLQGLQSWQGLREIGHPRMDQLA
jgi:hypothetical protein